MAYTREQLEEMTVAELRELAEEKDVDLSGAHRKDEIVEALAEALVPDPVEGVENVASSTLPIGLKESAVGKEAYLEGTWYRTEDGMYINSRDFNTRDGAVPQGVVRTLDEAYALEAAKIG